MSIIPDSPEVRRLMTLKYRVMQKQRGKTTTKWVTAPMYQPFTTGDGFPGIRAPQGLWRKLGTQLKEAGHDVTHSDKRGEFYTPDMGAAMIGLRPWQKKWIFTALLDGNSGLIGAPTRYGKSYGMTAICRAFPKARTIIVAPGVDLCRQLMEHFKEVLPHRDVRGLFTGSKNKFQGPDITIVSMDSLSKCDPDDTDLVIVDEPHAVVSDERILEFAKFTRARKYGFGATLNGRFDKKDPLIECLIGPVLVNTTYRQAVAEGAISPLKMLLIKIPFSKDSVSGKSLSRDKVYELLLTQSPRMSRLVKTLVDDVIPEKWQTMAFIKDEKQADFYLDRSMPPEGTVAMAKKLSDKERDIMTKGIAAGDILRVIASNIYVQGITFPDLKVVINLAGGGANTTSIQKPGRLLQTRPDKNYGVMFDFIFECTDKDMDERPNPPYAGIIAECWARHKVYKDIGYDVQFVDGKTAREIVKRAYGQNHPPLPAEMQPPPEQSKLPFKPDAHRETPKEKEWN